MRCGPPAFSDWTTLSASLRTTSKLLKGSRSQFWQTRFYDFNVFTQAKFVEKLRYIHRNPVTSVWSRSRKTILRLLAHFSHRIATVSAASM
jgi:hypothetical protein